MKLYRITLEVLGDELSLKEAAYILENQHYPNWCMSPYVVKAEVADIGEWTDDHPYNNETYKKQYVESIEFKEES